MNLSPLVLVAVAAAAPSVVRAAAPVHPLLPTHSKTLTVVDGDHVKANYWVLMPEKNPDVYYVEIPRKPHTVTFRSDVAELSFPVSFGESIDFVILLDDQTACRTQIRAAYRQLQPFSREPESARAEIPFTLGDNDKIYVRGRLNGGPELSFQFDLGCGGAIIKQNSVGKANMHFDGTITLANSDGVNQAPSSSKNHLQFGDLHWRDLPFAVADNMTHREDGLVGNNLFQDKVVEINYDRGVIAVHDALPTVNAAYSKHAVVLDGVVPFIRGSLEIGGERRERWFMLDTGAYTSILYAQEASLAGKLLAELRKLLRLDDGSTGPRLTIGDRAFANFNYSVRNAPRDDDQLGLLGNDLLKRFNVVLDNQQGFVYLQSNSHQGDAYANPEYYLARGIAAGGLGAVVAGAWFVRRRRSKRTSRLSNSSA